MKLAAPIFLSLVLLAGAYLVRARGKANSARQFASTDEFVEWLASEAVKDAWEQNHVKLDYSVGSVKNVAQILLQPAPSIHQGSVHDQRQRTRLGLRRLHRRSNSGEANPAPIGSVTMRWVKVLPDDLGPGTFLPEGMAL